MEEVKKEIRYINAELRASAEPDSREITGTAIVFNSTSELLGSQTGRQFHETIKPEAISDELIKRSDIVFLYNHSDSQGVLARSNRGVGSLKINRNEKGVNFSFKAKKTALGEEVLQAVREKDLEKCSFAMYVEQNGKNDTWSKADDGYYLRTINNINALYDMSVVPSPAYSDTQISTRGLDLLIENETKEMQKLETEKKSAEEKRIADDKIAEEKRINTMNTMNDADMQKMIDSCKACIKTCNDCVTMCEQLMQNANRSLTNKILAEETKTYFAELKKKLNL